jgi:hypothetical protein
MAEAPEEEEEEKEEGQWYSLETDLYVIDWGRERWTLGFEPGTFEHLDKLYIDQDGRIHRVVKPTSAEPEKQQADKPAVDKHTTSDEVAESENKI